MPKFCFQCGKALPGPVKFCPHCGALIAADGAGSKAATSPPPPPPPVAIAKPKPAPPPPPPAPPPPPPAAPPPSPPTQEDDIAPAAPPSSRAPWLVAIALAAVTISGLTYVSLSSPSDEADLVEEPDPTIEQSFYAAADAIIRTRATKYDSPQKGIIPRGQQISGYVETGVDGKSRWLRLRDGRGYVGMVNLTSTARPALAFRLDNRKWYMEAANTLYESPSEGGNVLAQLPVNEEVVLAGVTDNGFAEVKRSSGGVGYFPVRAQDDLGGYLHIKPKPIAVLNLTANNCTMGPDLLRLFEILGNRPATGGIYGPQTRYLAVNLDHAGLHLSGIGSHVMGKTYHFQATMDQAADSFSRLGYGIERDGSNRISIFGTDGTLAMTLIPADPENAQFGSVYGYCGF